MSVALSGVSRPIILVSASLIADGSGDAVCALIIAKIVQQAFREYDVWITLSQNNEENWLVLKEIVGNAFPIIESQKELQAKIGQIALQIVTTSFHALRRFGVPLQPRMGTFQGWEKLVIPTIVFSEYNSSPFNEPELPAYSLGLGKLGILIDQGWEEKHRLSQLPCKERYNQLLQNSPWKSLVLPKWLQAAVEEPRKLFLVYTSCDKVIEEFVIRMAGNNPGLPLTFVVATSARKGVQDIPVKEDRIQVIQERLSRDLFMFVLLISESECVVTGDQSFGEAVSSNKRITYATETHKQELNAAWAEIVAEHGDRANSEICRSHNANEKVIEIVKNHLLLPPTSASNIFTKAT